MREREFGADVVRILAVCLVFWLHFYLRNGFYYTPVDNLAGFIDVAFRPVFMCCIPLFLILTGYLKCGKPWKWSGYCSILPILTSYMLISMVHLLYKILIKKEIKPVSEWIQDFLGFRLANYGWYIGMYIGLFLLCPLMVRLWESGRNRKEHVAMILSLVMVTFLPSTVNVFAPDSDMNILPTYFTGMYYITYFLTGCYIRTYRPKVRVRIALPVIFLLGMLQSGMNLLTREEADNYYSGYSSDYSNLLIVVMAVLLFLSVYDLRCKIPWIRRGAAVVSGVVLEMYLISYIFDSNIYKLYFGKYSMGSYPWVGFLMTAAVFGLSFLTGKLIHAVTSGLLIKFGK